MKTGPGYTITRTTTRGTQEVLTTRGFKTRHNVDVFNLEIIYFDLKSGWDKVKTLKADCRIKIIRNSYMVNYS